MTDHIKTARSLAALGHDTRLAVFRLLVRAGHDGLNVGEIGQHLGAAPSTLAHHLSALVDAGLVIQTRQGRQIVNRVDFGAMQETVAFLTSECCVGVTLNKEDAA
ncbi:helix-turn-helix transcriptional regulator [Sulfitobacter sp. CW3]|uniref:ArsR/SmtB family transcription factor n=1 Tax=Sulfitobacter sp. CW3 TaxID=2861965 RepID=UPI001C5D482C|nr:metalloregulator ArsR/SmtB family transcription factor [Sulfitobacter sp. CW3]MBW4963085.1 metalloregulator ArsR/SmtB family transcription factor [Sulfitobacter sp. CW3]|tara:strand:+ start:49087 stop:49401 length:315 start_codon:yes stop_codon:yes gene_type:complete